MNYFNDVPDPEKKKDYNGFYPDSKLLDAQSFPLADLSSLEGPEKVDLDPLKQTALGNYAEIQANNPSKKGLNLNENTLHNIGAATNLLGGMLQQNTAKSPYEVDNTNYQMEAAKDATASAFPIAGVFRGIEKSVVGIAGSTHGAEGKDISQAMFSPSSNISKLSKADNLSSADKAKGYFGTIFAPGLAGQMISRDRKLKEQEIAQKIRDEKDKKAELDRKMSYDIAMGEKISKKELDLAKAQTSFKLS